MERSRTITSKAATTVAASLLLLASCGRSTQPTEEQIRAKTEQVVNILEAKHSEQEKLEGAFAVLRDKNLVANNILIELKRLSDIPERQRMQINGRAPTNAYIKLLSDANQKEIEYNNRKMSELDSAVGAIRQDIPRFLIDHYPPEYLAEIKAQMDRDIDYRNPNRTPTYYKNPAWDASQVQMAHRRSINEKNTQNFYLRGGAVLAVVLTVVGVLEFVF